MHQLIYISTAQRDITSRDVEQILTVSQQNNGRVDLTGLLLFDGRRFLQALEGPEDEVAATFERVKDDPRHRAIVLLSSKTIADRQFGKWAMTWQSLDPGVPGNEYREAVDALTASVTDPNAKELFRGFARIDRKAA